MKRAKKEERRKWEGGSFGEGENLREQDQSRKDGKRFPKSPFKRVCFSGEVAQNNIVKKGGSR